MGTGDALHDVVANLRRRRADLQKELLHTDLLISEFDAMRTRLSELEVGVERTNAGSQSVALESPLPKVVRFAANELGRMSYAEAAKLAIRRAGRPVGTKELLSFLELGGRPVGARDPYRALYRVLMMNDAFEIRDKRWTLVAVDRK